MAVTDTQPVLAAPAPPDLSAQDVVELGPPMGGLVFSPPPDGPRGIGAAAKRGIDVVGSVILLVLAAPLFAVIAMSIKLDSPGPVFFRQQRMGRDGRRFRIYKFRSMVADAELLRSALLAFNEVKPPLFKIRSDPRVTRVGRFLRRCSLDELPQLINILTGEMSLVGPRPPFDHEFDDDYVHQCLRLHFRPGLTGLWQVSGRSGLDYERMIRLDLRYTREWSFWLDLKILFRTIPTVISGKGAC